MLKTRIIRIVVTLAFLLTLGAFFGAASSSTAHAATLPTAAAASPHITIANCTDPGVLQIYTLDNTETCFSGSGYTPATIPNVIAACSGNTTADVSTDHGTFLVSVGQGCHSFTNSGTVTVIGVNIR